MVIYVPAADAVQYGDSRLDHSQSQSDDNDSRESDGDDDASLQACLHNQFEELARQACAKMDRNNQRLEEFVKEIRQSQNAGSESLDIENDIGILREARGLISRA